MYGTLRPGDVRWHHLRPFVVDDGWADEVTGSVYDTGLDYPAAIFDGSATIHGRTYALLETSLRQCLAILDDVEGVVDGGYRRVVVTTARSVSAWAYEYGTGLDLTLIESGDWLDR